MEISNLSDVVLRDTDLILLDLDNTLYEYKGCHEKALGVVVDKVSRHFTIDRSQVYDLYMKNRRMVNERHKGTAAAHSRLFYIQAMVEELIGTTDVEWIRLLYKLYWDVYIDAMTLFPDAVNFLDNCLVSNIPIVLVTDMIADVQMRKITKLKICKYLKFIVTSEEAGIEKPDPFIFEIAIQKISGQKPGIKQIAVIGDDIKKDVYSSSEYDVTIYHIISK